MLSLVAFGVCGGLTLLKYNSTRNKYNQITNAREVSEGGQGMRYNTGFLRPLELPIDYKGLQLLSLQTKKYDIYQELVVFGGSAYTQSEKVFKDSTLTSTNVVVENKEGQVDISHLMPLFHSLFAEKIDQPYQSAGPVDLFNTNLSFGNIKLQTQNKQLAGYLTKVYGFKYDPQTSYTILGPYNGQIFYNTEKTIVCKNKSIEELRADLRSEVIFWEVLSLACVVGGLISETCELCWGV